jgi:cholesterol transport system auxiliary component
MAMIANRPALALTALLTLAGCAPHKVQYYQLSAVQRQSAAREPRPSPDSGAVILVGRIATPLALQDGRIRYREGLNEVGAYEYHRWTDPPGIMVRDRLIDALRSSGFYKTVQEADTSSTGDYTVRGKLVEFSEIDGAGIDTRVSLDLELREGKTGRVVWTRNLTHDDPVTAAKSDSKKVSDVVQSLDRNLHQVIAEASEEIGSYVAAHPHP